MTKQISGPCDKCGEYRWLRATWIEDDEVWHCDECLGIEPDPDVACDERAWSQD
jgi:hypothetical protein